jgi:oligopeptide transport system permease protein
MSTTIEGLVITMLKYILKRLFLSVIVIILTTTILYLVSYTAMLKNYALASSYKEGFNMAWDYYKLYVKNIIVNGDFGYSTAYRKDIVELIAHKIPVTLKINVIAFLVYVPVGITLGVISAYYKDSLLDRVISYITLSLVSIPIFIWIFILILVIGYTFMWLPPIYSQVKPGFIGGITIYIIPVTALSIEPISRFTRLIRAELVNFFNTEAHLLLKVKGLTKLQIILRHQLRNAIIAIYPEFNSTFITVLIGSFIVEKYYSVQGVSKLFFDSMLKKFAYGNYVSIDIELFAAISLFYISYITIAALLVDISFSLLDPRIVIYKK